MATISLEQVTKIYPNGFQAIHELDLEVADGEFMVLVGPSGCGKTTALRMVAGLEDVTYGKLRIGDRVVNDASPRDRDIAMVFQNYSLYPHMTVAANIGFALQLRKLPKTVIGRRSTTPSNSSGSPSARIINRASSPAASASASRWAGRSCASRACS